jgi:PAS domain S-box-containing protein
MTGIPNKLNLSLAGITILFFAIYGAISYHAGLLEIQNETDNSIEIISNRLAINLRQSVYEFDIATINDSVLAEFPNPDISAIMVWTSDRQRLLCALGRNKETINEITEAPTGTHIVSKSRPLVIITEAEDSSRHQVGELCVFLNKNVAYKRLIAEIVQDFSQLTLIILLLLVLLAAMTNRFIVLPLEKIRLAMHSIKTAFQGVDSNQSTIPEPDKLFPDGLKPGYSELQEIGQVLETMVTAIGDNQKALRKSEQNYREIFNKTSDAIFIHDIETGNILDINQTTLDLYGYSYDEALSMNIEDFSSSIPPYTQQDAIQYVQKAVRQGSQTFTWHAKKKNGQCFWVEVVLSCTQIGGKGRVMAVIRDINDRVEVEKEREELLKTLKSKNKELQSIVYVTSHDLRSPLVNIAGFSGELRRSYEQLCQAMNNADMDTSIHEKLNAIIQKDVAESLEYIAAGTEKMQLLLDGLLQVSRIGTEEIDVQRLNMNEMLHQIVKNVQYQTLEQGIEVTVKDVPDCLGDSALTNQVFSNLLDNALKYLDPERPGEIHFSGSTDGRINTYCVEDNGIGIASEHIHKIFEVFHRLNPEDAASGEGLGLTIVTRALDRLTGHIQVESIPNQGSKFYVSLPAV